MRLGVRIGQGCARLLDRKVRGLDSKSIQVDEIWDLILVLAYARVANVAVESLIDEKLDLPKKQRLDSETAKKTQANALEHRLFDYPVKCPECTIEPSKWSVYSEKITCVHCGRIIKRTPYPEVKNKECHNREPESSN